MSALARVRLCVLRFAARSARAAPCCSTGIDIIAQITASSLSLPLRFLHARPAGMPVSEAFALPLAFLRPVSAAPAPLPAFSSYFPMRSIATCKHGSS